MVIGISTEVGAWILSCSSSGPCTIDTILILTLVGDVFIHYKSHF